MSEKTVHTMSPPESPDPLRKAEELLSAPLPQEEPDRSREIKRRVKQAAQLLTPPATPA